MTETRLRTITHMAGYLTASFFIAVLAMQNLRYGFYDLFYLATVMGLIGVTGCIYTLVYRRQQLSARGHLPILAALNGGLIVGMLALEPVGISYWVLPLLLLNLLGGRLPMGYRMAGASAGAVQRRVQDRLERVLRRMVRVAGLLDEALLSAEHE